MTLRRWGMEGVPQGVGFTASTLVSTDPTGGVASQVNTGGGTATSDNTHVATGTQAIKFAIPTTSTNIARIPLVAASQQAAISVKLWLAAAPGGNFQVLTARHSAGTALRVQINSTGKLVLLNQSGAIVGTSTGSLTFNQWVRIEVVLNTAVGSASLRGYAGDSTTVDAQVVAASGADLTTNTVVAVDIGSSGGNGTGAAIDMWVDDLQTNDGATVEIGPYVAPPAGGPPTLVVTRHGNEVADLRTSSTGDSSSPTWPAPTLVSGPTLTVTSLDPGLWHFTPDVAAPAVYTVSVSQADTQTASANITIDPATGTVVPLRIGTLLRSGGAWL